MLSSRRAVSIAGLLFATALSLPGLSLGFVESDHQLYDINRIDPPLFHKASDNSRVVSELQTAPAWVAWQRQYPAWRVSWNTTTRTPHRAYGPGVQIREFGPLTEDNIDAACRSFLSQTSSWSGVRGEELQLVQARKRLDRWYVVFQQTVQGIPVRGGRADLRLGANGEVMLVGADWYPDVDVSTKPRIVAATALDAASRDLQSPPTAVEVGAIIVPRVQADGLTYRLAHELRFRTKEPLGNWYCLVDAGNGEVLLRENLVRFVSVEGRVTADVEPSTVGDTPEELPLRDTRLDVEDGSEFGYTDVDGRFSVETVAADSVMLSSGLQGMFARVFNASLNGETPRIDTKILPPTPYDFHWDDSNSRASERDAYYHTLVAHDYINGLDPAFTGVDYQMPVTVDIPNRDCNAFYDGLGINFFSASERCPNTARIADVVYHEYGHGITDWQYRPFRPNSAMHEAFSDYIAATMTDQPEIGRGFRGPGTIIRTIDNTRRYPEDLVGEEHIDGLILGGALWDLREAVGAELADVLWHFARYGLADNFDDYMLDVLATDDDNANIYDGTPHFDEIVTAFMSHGIGDYSVQVSHLQELDTEDVNKPLVIEATILSIFALDPASVLLHYRANEGEWLTLQLTETGAGPREFGVTIPPQSAETSIDYYLSAADTEGHESTLPVSAPEVPFTFRIGTDTTAPLVVFESLTDRPLDAPGWPLRVQVTDNLDAGLSSVRVEFSRNSMGLDQSLDLLAVDDSRWLATLPVAGAVLGDVISYRIVATDAAGVPNVAITPPTGSYSFKVVQGSLRDLESDAGGLTADGDWQWGEPTTGPEQAFSGAKVWATGLDGAYTNNATSMLQLPTMDLGTWARASLVFRHWVSAEEFFDGGRVEISTDGGLSWSALQPNGGYPSPFLAVFTGPGYSGTSLGWRAAEFELSRYLGQVVDVRLRFASDGGIVDTGWYVDDLEFVERQVLSVPVQLSAFSGRDTSVPLSWQPPSGIDPQQTGTPLEGYNVYRSTNPDFTDAMQLNVAVLTSTSFLDLDVVNGTSYYYAVTALYAEGESERSRIQAALPYRAVYEADTSELVVVSESAAVDTSVTLSNGGTGFLEVDLWLGDPGDSLDDVRIAYFPQDKDDEGTSFAAATASHASGNAGRPQLARAEVLAGLAAGNLQLPNKKLRFSSVSSPSVAYLPLYSDTSEPDTTPDLHELLAKAESGSLFFKVTGHAPWGNILTDFTLILSIDADANLGTGDAQGADFYVLIGAFPMAQFGAPAFIASSDQQFVGVPTHLVFSPDSDFVEVGFPHPLVGSPFKLVISYMALGLDFNTPIDMAPNPRMAASWLTPAGSHVVVPAGEPTELGLSFADGLPPAAYEGQLLMETNDPDTQVATIPVRYLFGVTPVELFDLTAVQERSDVVIRWRTALEENVSAFRIYRARQEGAFAALADVEPSIDRRYFFRDTSPEPGDYSYRVAEVAMDGAVTLHAGVDVAVTAAAPLRAFLENAPNPFNPSTTFHYGVVQAGPVRLEVYDARGRMVKTLVNDVQVSPGFYRQTWNGIDDQGRSAASGIYHARLIVNGEVLSRRLTLLK